MKTPSRSESVLRRVAGQPSWRLVTADVEAHVTELGGHLGPVAFDRRKRRIAPLSVAPWAEEAPDPSLPAILRVLRGDFFCMPFGGNSTEHRGERHPVHGETANARWKLESLDLDRSGGSIHLSLKTTIRPGRVDKRISLRSGHLAAYSEHVISGMSGPMNLGHHAMLRFPDEPGSGAISTSRFVHGQVFPGALEEPEKKGYSFLRPGARFARLDEVPTMTGETADLSRYPARRGWEDLAMIVSDPDLPFAWTCVTFPRERYVWFSLKDPRVLAGTIFWISNGGRHYPPWNGRHVNVMGLEEVTSYFHHGLAESARPNPFSREGYPTCIRLDARRPFAVRTIFGVAPVPAGFDRVAAIEPARGGAIVIRSASGKRARAAVDLDFLSGGPRTGSA